jgi:hypothetical protein
VAGCGKGVSVRHSVLTAGNSAKLGCRDPTEHVLGGDRSKVADVERVHAVAFHFRRALQMDCVVNSASDHGCHVSQNLILDESKRFAWSSSKFERRIASSPNRLP